MFSPGYDLRLKGRESTFISFKTEKWCQYQKSSGNENCQAYVIFELNIFHNLEINHKPGDKFALSNLWHD